MKFSLLLDVPVWIVEGDRIDYILMSLQSVQFFAGGRIPDFTRTIVRTGDKSRFHDKREE